MRRLSVLISLFLLLIGSGCTNENVDVDQIMNQVTEAQENLSAYHAIVSSTSNYDGEEETIRYEEWIEKPNKSRMEYEDGYLIVSNGESTWIYNEQANEVIVEEEMATGDMNQTDFLKDMIQEMVDNNTVEIMGSEEVSGRDAYHVMLTPKDTKLYQDKMEFWFDKETWLPLKIHTGMEGFETTIVYESIKFSEDQDDSLFTFEIPDGTNVLTSDDFEVESQSPEEIIELATFPVPEITKLPENYELGDSYYDQEYSMANFVYYDKENEYESIALMVSADPDGEMLHEIPYEDGETVTIDGKEMTYIAYEEMQSFIWGVNGMLYDVTIMSQDISKEEAMDIVKSVE
ncbi:outer membrane lipoprotein-sorting protein [Radiobacillus kanasensis]|uniref:outer membrane lipoprotein-sorting protein n=1 Tax=Radiobacillus kanasensis TaxID=2844358 RepID=UPI001E496ACA|nr:outer membrane lipoprotein-sorting protein [Radiobacillus kanasensis]UFU00420.1 outer membrane lipoprotein-sorting protein [Radiobacillus kanasensis]